MGVDTFICGECQHVFYQIDDFVNHKGLCHQRIDVSTTPVIIESDKTEHIEVIEGDPGDINVQYAVTTSSGDLTQQFLKPMHLVDDSGQQFYHHSQPVTIVQQENGVQFMEIPQVQADGTSVDGQMVAAGDEQGVVVFSHQQLQSFQQQFGGEVVQVEMLDNRVHDMTDVTDSEIINTPIHEDIELNCNQIQLVPVKSSKGSTTDLQVVVKTPKEILEERIKQQKSLTNRNFNEGADSSKQTPGKKRGRPKKGEQKKVDPDEKPVVVRKEEKPPLPEKGADGRYHCNRCKKAFNRERHFKTHRCLTWSDYVNITEKDSLEMEVDDLEDPSFSLQKTRKCDLSSIQENTGGKEFVAIKYSTIPMESSAEGNEQQDDFPNVIPSDSKTNEIENTPEIIVHNVRKRGRKPKNTHTIYANNDITESKDKAVIEDKPIFTTEEDKVAFDMAMNIDLSFIDNLFTPIFTTEEDKVAFDMAMNIDLSFIDNLFTAHTIDQEMNSHQVVTMGRSPNQITIFTCNECKRVFMSLSQCRLHCISHSDVKPFKCIKCAFTTNSKGNIYTHMRQHTGQFYKCTHCSFQSGNKTHLIEHQETHLGIKKSCNLCSKQYSTTKSLANHVRAYHQCDKGKEYLTTFLVRGHRGQTTVLHQCHVCNRKFKKKVDRDRHLYFHDLDDVPYIFRCDVCPYSTNRRTYLDKHYLKHKVIYVCCVCKTKCMSTKRLNEHLHLKHGDVVGVSGDNTYLTWKDLFEKCIANSYFLPETISEAVVQVENIQDEATGEIYQHLYVQTNYDQLDAMNEESTENPEIVEGEPEAEEDLNPEEDVYKRNGYKKLTRSDLDQIYAIFGSEECQHCGRLFPTSEMCEQHEHTHTGHKPFACESCPYTAITKDNLKRHNEREHQQVQYKCTYCEFTGNTRTQLWTHQRQMHSNIPALCTQCGQRFPDFKILKAHLQVKHPSLTYEQSRRILFPFSKNQLVIGRRVYKCNYCDKTFLRDYNSFQRHLWMHQGIKPFKCTECSYSCRNKHNLKSHMLRHSSVKPFKCPTCQKGYKSKTALRWHVRSHQVGRQFQCEKCNYSALQESHLKRHLETHNLIRRYKCQMCDYSCNTPTYLKGHWAKQHPGYEYNLTWEESETPEVDINTKVYKCLSCDFIYGNLTDMKRHLKLRHFVRDSELESLNSIQFAVEETSQTVGQVEVMASDENMLINSINSVPDMDENAISVNNIVDQEVISSDPGIHQEVEIAVSVDPKSLTFPRSNHKLHFTKVGEISRIDNNQEVILSNGSDEVLSENTQMYKKEGEIILTHDVNTGLVNPHQQVMVVASNSNSPTVFSDRIMVQSNNEGYSTESYDHNLVSADSKMALSENTQSYSISGSSNVIIPSQIDATTNSDQVLEENTQHQTVQISSIAPSSKVVNIAYLSSDIAMQDSSTADNVKFSVDRTNSNDIDSFKTEECYVPYVTEEVVYKSSEISGTSNNGNA